MQSRDVGKEHLLTSRANALHSRSKRKQSALKLKAQNVNLMF